MDGLSQKEIDTLKAQVLPFFREREAILVTYLFGSALREKTFRDLDFAILCERTFARSKEAFACELRWAAELERVLKPRRPVDLRMLNQAPVHFQHEVIRTGVIVFERDRDARVLFEMRVLSMYMDYEPWRRFFDEQLLTRLRS